MDNQQATAILEWLIGFMEGEGCFLTYKKKTDQNRAEIRISNTEIDLLKFCSDFLKQNFILNDIYQNKRIGKNKIVYDLYIRGLQDCKTLYHLVKEKMTCRIDELDKIVGASTTTRETSLSLSWLVGLFEAEGCFTINTQTHKTGFISHNPVIIMEHTHPLVIEKTVKILHHFGLAWYARDRVFKNPKWKPSVVITITGCKRVRRFLQLTENLYIGSKTIRKVRILTEYYKSRLSKQPKEPYSTNEHQLAHEIKMKI